LACESTRIPKNHENWSPVKIFQAVEFALQGAVRCGCDLPENVIGRTDRTKPLRGVIGEVVRGSPA
jgi:hypothetical protein